MDLLEFFNSNNVKDFNLFKNAISTNKDTDTIFEKNVISTINTKFERIKLHGLGLNLLYKYLPEISTELLIKYFPYWIGKITYILTNSDTNSVELVAACKTICSLIAICKKVPELDKRISIFHVKQLVGILVDKYHDNNSNVYLNLLIALLYHYPESCIRFQSSFTKIISSCIDKTSNELVTSGAKCYSLLVKVLERSFAHISKNEQIIFPDNPAASCHVLHQISLCDDLSTILDELFQSFIINVTEFPFQEKNVSKVNNLELPELSCKDLLKYYNAIQNRFKNICFYLSTLLKIGASGDRKYVLPNVILQVLCKGLSITPTNLQKENKENRRDLLMFILPTIHISLFNVLTDLINSYCHELIPFASIIQRLIIQTLDWTQNHKSFRDVRIIAYRNLSLWLQQIGNSSGFQLVADEILPHLLKDLKPSRKNVLTLNKKETKALMKSNSKSKKEIQVSQDCNEVDTVIFTDPAINIQALTTVRSIISNSNLYLRSSFYTEIRNIIVTALHEYYAKNCAVESNESRLHLIKTLRFLQIYGHTTVPSPTADAIHIFGKALNQDQLPEIIEEAKLGLAEIRHIVYPAAPSLMLPLSNVPISPPSSRSTSPVQQRDMSRLIPTKRNQNLFTNDTDENVKRSKKEENVNTTLESLEKNDSIMEVVADSSLLEENSKDENNQLLEENFKDNSVRIEETLNDKDDNEEKEESLQNKKETIQESEETVQESEEIVQKSEEAAPIEIEKDNSISSTTQIMDTIEQDDNGDDMILAFCDVTN